MKKITTWIVVADGARARIVKNEGPGKGLVSAMDHDFAAPHVPSRDQGSDRPGRGFKDAAGARHGMEPGKDFHVYEKARFAKDIAGVLDRAAESGAYDRLLLVAPPKTLGALRKALGNTAKGRLTGHLDKDLTHLEISELQSHLDVLIPV
jgi:protein required for attachment to host cells